MDNAKFAEQISKTRAAYRVLHNHAIRCETCMNAIRELKAETTCSAGKEKFSAWSKLADQNYIDAAR